ncbi:MAG: transcriptional repressor [Rhodospirillales bacterium]|nr:transcriptional repressor [Rhodospirillales bacterium]MBI3114151.1 transcriptional repressor [Rhodospirillales bacterium]
MTNKESIRPYTQVLDRLRTAGLRPTRQRLALAKLLFEGGDRHVTAEMLHAEAQTAAIRVSLATVYNTLHQFTTAGLLREIVVDSQRSYFDTNMADHHHFFFEGSSQLEDIPGHEVIVTHLPTPPKGKTVKRVDVILRVSDK